MANLYTIENLLVGKTYKSKTLRGEIISAEKSSQPIWYGENTEPYLVSVYSYASPYLSIVRYHDKDQDLIFIPERNNLVLSNTPNPVGKCLARVALRSSLDGEARGQFDDVLSVQLARARFAVLQIQAAEKSIQAPSFESLQ